MQAVHYPVFPTTPDLPAGSQVDIVSWSTEPAPSESDEVTTVFGYFRPLVLAGDNNTNNSGDGGGEAVLAAWNYSSTGPLEGTTNLWAILGWGFDRDGVEYRVDYEGGYYVDGGDAGNVHPCINIASRSVEGPEERTYKEIVEALVEVGREAGDDGFVRLVGELLGMKSDGRRRKGVDVECDEACVMNKDLVPGR